MSLHELSRCPMNCTEMSKDIKLHHEMPWDITRHHETQEPWHISQDIRRHQETSCDTMKSHESPSDVMRHHEKEPYKNLRNQRDCTTTWRTKGMRWSKEPQEQGGLRNYRGTGGTRVTRKSEDSRWADKPRTWGVKETRKMENLRNRGISSNLYYWLSPPLPLLNSLRPCSLQRSSPHLLSCTHTLHNFPCTIISRGCTTASQDPKCLSLFKTNRQGVQSL